MDVSWTTREAKLRRIDAFELWCWRRLLRVPWTARRSKPVDPKGNQFWTFIDRTDVETAALILWPPDAKNWLTGRDPDAGKDWRQEEKGMTEDEMVGGHHRLHGPKFEQPLGVGDGQGSLACCSPSGLKESDATEQLNCRLRNAGKKMFVLFSSLRTLDPYLLLESPRPLSPPQRPQTSN